MKKSLFIILLLCGFIRNSYADCPSGQGLNDNGVCMNCSGSHQTIKDNKCYTCTGVHIKKCEVDENGNAVIAQCADGYGLNSDNVCIDCHYSNQVIKDNKCYTCVGYSRSVKKCEVDEDGNAVIAQCADGYGLNSDNVCIDCHYSNQVIKDNKCYTCVGYSRSVKKCEVDEDGNAVIAQCADGYGLNSDNVCVNCSYPHQTIKDNKCYTCVGNANTVKKCEIDENGNAVIVQCADGWGLNSDNVCVYCHYPNQTIKDNKCYTCPGIGAANTVKKCEVDEDGNAVIAECVNGYGLNSDNVCVNCRGSHQTIKDNKCYTCPGIGAANTVKKCEVDENGKAVIAECVNGYGLNSDNVCIDCHYSNQVIKDNKCYKCAGNPNTVKKCEVDENGNAVIAQCADGWGLNSDNVCIDCRYSNQVIKDNKCYKCAGNPNTVKKCEVDEDGNAVIAECINGYALNDNGECMNCSGSHQTIKDNKCYTCGDFIAGCNTCGKVDEELVCNKCTSGTLTNGLCVGNQNQTCAMDKFLTLAGTCVEKCPIGQYGDKQSGKCQKIAENCAEMLAGTTCKTCDKGFLEKDGYCVSTEVGCGANYIQIENWCNRVRYTPAEAAEIAKDDGNVVTITFRK